MYQWIYTLYSTQVSRGLHTEHLPGEGFICGDRDSKLVSDESSDTAYLNTKYSDMFVFGMGIMA